MIDNRILSVNIEDFKNYGVKIDIRFSITGATPRAYDHPGCAGDLEILGYEIVGHEYRKAPKTKAIIDDMIENGNIYDRLWEVI